jgi:integrase
MPRVRLHPREVEHLTTDKVREEWWDTVTPGLILRVSGETGHKSWYVRYRVNGARRRLKIGTYPRIGLAAARKKARDKLEEADAGEDPAAQREEQRAGGRSFEVMAREVLTARALRTRDRTQYERERILERELLPHWKHRDAATISRREVVELVEGIAKRGAPVAANRTLALVRLLYNDGLRRGFPGLEANPAHMVEPPGAERGRDRYLLQDEIRTLWKVTEAETPGTKWAFRLALLTAQRIGSVVAMRWEDVVGDLWTIPAESFKGKRTHLAPLSVEALEVLSELEKIREEGKAHVFPSRAGAKLPHLGNLTSSSLPRVRKATKIPHWTIHDFRTTFRTWAVRSPSDGGLGIAGHVADAVLGHKEASLGFARYTGDRDRYMLAEKREALQGWGAFVRAAVEGEGGL